MEGFSCLRRDQSGSEGGWSLPTLSTPPPCRNLIYGCHISKIEAKLSHVRGRMSLYDLPLTILGLCHYLDVRPKDKKTKNKKGDVLNLSTLGGTTRN